MADQQQPTVAGSPVQSGTQASVPIRPIDGAQGFLVRALSLTVVLFTLFAWIGGWIPETQVAWVIVIIGC